MAKLTGDRAFGRNLKRLLCERDMTHDELERAIDLSKGQASYWSRGIYGITLHNLRKVKAALGCTWDELLGP